MLVDRRKNLGCEFVLFKQAAELQQRRRVGCQLAIKVEANEAKDRLAVVDRVFDSFVGQAETLLRHIHAQHARQANRPAPGAFSLRVKRRDQLMQLRPRGHLIDLGEEADAPRQLLLGDVFEVKKLFCMIDWTVVGVPILSQVSPWTEPVRENKSAFP